LDLKLNKASLHPAVMELRGLAGSNRYNVSVKQLAKLNAA